MSLKFLNIPFLNLPCEVSVSNFLNDKKKAHAIFVNPHSLLFLKKNSNLLLQATKYIFCDGVGIKFIFALFMRKIYRIPGHLFFFEIIKQLSKKKKKINFFLFGSSKLNCELFKKNIEKQHRNIKVKGFISPPIFNQKLDNSLNDRFIKQINKSKSDILIVSLTAPKQEMWVTDNFKKIKINKIISLGAVVDYFALHKFFFVKLFSRVGLEWLYRLIIQPRNIFIRIFYSFPFLLIYSFLNRKTLFANNKINKKFIITNKKKLISLTNKKNSFILSALNLNNFAQIISGVIDVKNHHYWIDGLVAKYKFKLQKISGYKILLDILLLSKFKSILVIGNYNKINKIYLKKYCKKIFYYPIPYVNIHNCYKIKINFKFSKDQLILLTLPTPKQEIIANQIAMYNKNVKIICIGGGLNIASGYEKEPTLFIKKYELEWLWRLRTDFLRRTIRLVNSFIIYIFNNEQIK